MVGDLGVSVNGQQSIAELVGNRMNNSLLLAFCALLVGVPLAIFLGVITALWRDKPIDLVLSLIHI